jgi:tetratricopeptide (TPR) repeat protein
MSARGSRPVRLSAAALGAALAVSACALVGPPYTARHPQPAANGRSGVISQPVPASAPPTGALSSAAPQPLPGSANGAAPAVHYQLGPATEALVSTARAQEQGGNFSLAAETLERALSIEPRNPLVWLALGRESLAAGNAAQADGMARKALYLASGDAAAQASSWGLIAAALRAEGRNQQALAAEQRAAQLQVQ